MTSKYSVELFMEACGATGPLHLSLQDSSRPGPLRRVFHQPFVVIGREPTSDLLLDNWRVSRRHAYMQIVKGKLFCVDLGSRTGIAWEDGSRDSGWLDPGRALIVGPYEIGLWADKGPESSHEPKTSDNAGKATQTEEESSNGSYAIEFLSSSGRLPAIRLGQSMALVGSSSDCRVRLPYSDVSKAHCALIRSRSGVWVVDLLGRGGTYVNETHVRFARIDDGDELRIGRHILRFDIDGSRSSVPRLADTPIPPSRNLIHRPSSERMPALVDQRHQNPPALPSVSASGIQPAETWQYPEYEVQRVVSGTNYSDQVELVQALMQPMVQQFGLMQQQMFEQFHQAMMGMFQTFGAAHRDQMNDLREELDEVRRITSELQELQTQAAAAAAAQAEAAKVPPAPAPVPARHPAQPRPTSPPTHTAKPHPAAPQSPTQSDSRTRPAEPSIPLPPRPRPQAAAPAPAPAEDVPPPRKPPTKIDVAVHNVLFDRINSLQTERQTRWQKILAKLNKT